MRLKIQISIILASTVLLLSCGKEHLTPDNELVKVISNINTKNAIRYDLDYHIKYFDYPDTTNITAKTLIVKKESDSLFGGYIWYSRKDSLNDYVKYYDLNSFYVINNKTKQVIRYNPEKPIPYGFTNNFDGKLLKTYFLQTKSLENLHQDTIYKSKVTSEDGLLKMSVVYPDDNEIINQKKEIVVDNTSNTVKQIIFKAELDSLHEYNEWNLTNVVYDDLKAEDLEEKFHVITKEYTFQEYQPPSKEERLPLAIGQKAENFKGTYLLGDHTEFNLSDYSGSILILDFWYRTCPPCIKSMPQLNAIYSKYKSKGVHLFGLNDIDTDSISRQRLIPFIEKQQIEYPTVFIDHAVSEMYKVRGYPTLYVIDKNEKIAYSKLGYSENLEKELDSILKTITQ